MFKKFRRFIGPRMRVAYWSDSALADKIRQFVGIVKPSYATLEEWADWKTNYIRNHPFVYWVTEKYLNNIQRMIATPYDLWNAIVRYIDNRFIYKLHVLECNLSPGGYYEFDDRLLHGAFQGLVDYVEIDCAVSSFRKVKKESFLGKVIRYVKLEKFRDRAAGVEKLFWEANLVEDEWGISTEKLFQKNCLKPSPQAIKAQQVYDLYIWWTEIRTKRIDPYDDQFKDEDYKFRREMEQKYEDEDEDMLIKLIKVRKSMST